MKLSEGKATFRHENRIDIQHQYLPLQEKLKQLNKELPAQELIKQMTR